MIKTNINIIQIENNIKQIQKYIQSITIDNILFLYPLALKV